MALSTLLLLIPANAMLLLRASKFGLHSATCLNSGIVDIWLQDWPVDLPQTLYEVTRAARALRDLSDYLDRHPSSLITGRAANE